MTELQDKALIQQDAATTAILDALVSGECDLETVLQQLMSALNYVHAFGTAEFSIEGSSHSKDALALTYANLNLALAHACDLPSADSPTDALAPHSEFFRKIVGARRIDQPRVRVFTTNYDLAIEKSLDRSGIRYVDGFRGGVSKQLDLNSFSTDVFVRSATDNGGHLVRLHELVQLYKIHGSLDWRRGEEANGLKSSGIIQSTDKATASNLAVIYPTPAKDSDVLGYPYSDLLRLFGTSLSLPESALIVTGYGFADDHINRLIGQALTHNPTMQLLVVEPFGVLDRPKQDRDPEFGTSIAAELAKTPDSRISVLTGDAAEFIHLHQLLPDVNPYADASPVNFSDILRTGEPNAGR